MILPSFCAAAALMASAPWALAGAAARLSIFIQDNHAASFGWIARHAPLDTPHVLVLIDAHSDAGRIGNSDQLRHGLRRVASAEERARRIQSWLTAGDVQAFNWIEPLMPLPVTEVLWLQEKSVNRSEIRRREKTAREFLDANLDHRPRESGPLADRFHGADAAAIRRLAGDPRPVLATFDLDALTGLTPQEMEQRFMASWQLLTSLPQLSIITFAISRPWLKNDEESHRLLEIAMRAALAVENADLTFEPFAVEPPDRSEEAKHWHDKGLIPPRYSVREAPPALRRLLLQNRARIRVETDIQRWNLLLDAWSDGIPEWTITAEAAWPSADGVWRLPADTQTPLQVSCPDNIQPQSVRWFSVEPEHPVYNVLPQLPSGKVFTGAGSPAVSLKPRPLAALTDDARLAASSWKSPVSSSPGWGTLRLTAEITWTSGGKTHTSLTPEMEIRLSAIQRSPFHTALSGGFRRPYIFGAGLVTGDLLTGPEACAGNDCANFLVAAWRRTGRALPWCNPEQLRPWLLPVATGIRMESLTVITEGSVEQGLAVHLGSHVAAVWEDREPVGKLDAGDLVAHHLSGLPEIIPLRQLLKGRTPQFDLLRAPGPADAALSMVFGGDVILTAQTLTSGLQTKLAQAVQSADFAMANLECSPAAGNGPFPDAPDKPFRFIADATRAAAWCRAQGLDSLTLGNNHAEDAGAVAFAGGVAALKHAGLAVTGAGNNLATALEPVVWEKNGLRIACFSMNMVNAENFSAAAATPGTVSLPQHADALAAAMDQCRAAQPSTFIIALPHWGREGMREVSPLQREWARWFIDHGADAVVGCGPHLCQELDAWRGRPVCYSTGNFHAHPFGPPEFAERKVLRLALASDGTVIATEWISAPSDG